MAHFAKLDDNNIVLEVNVVNNEDLNNLPFPESEEIGIQFLTAWSNGYTNWKQTSYNSSFRKNYATIGGVYDPVLDAFLNIKEHPSWVLNTEFCRYEPPIPFPEDGLNYYWDEPTLSWKGAE